jgi:hypothetical protein
VDDERVTSFFSANDETLIPTGGALVYYDDLPSSAGGAISTNNRTSILTRGQKSAIKSSSYIQQLSWAFKATRHILQVIFNFHQTMIAYNLLFQRVHMVYRS